MSTGGSSAAPTEQTVTQTNIPKEFMPYFERLMGRVEEQSLQPYQGYEGQRLATADQFADIGASRDATRALVAAGTPGLTEAQGMTRTAAEGILGLAGQDPFQFSQYGGFQAGQAQPYAGFQATQVQPYAGFQAGQAQPFADFSEAGYREFGFGPSGEFTGAAVGQYMDPYIQNVVDAQKRKAKKTTISHGRGVQLARLAPVLSAGPALLCKKAWLSATYCSVREISKHKDYPPLTAMPSGCSKPTAPLACRRSRHGPPRPHECRVV